MDRNLVVLAGGIASRMKASALNGHPRHAPELLDDARQKPKGMMAVGPGRRPFLDYLFRNARDGGIRTVIVVIGESDDSIIGRYGLSSPPVQGLEFGFVRQPIPPGRTKPLGTADALQRALDARPEWKGSTFIVCNSDNLYSPEAFRALLESPARNALIEYERSALRFDAARIARFALIRTDPEGYVTDLLEKPGPGAFGEADSPAGAPGVSMNIYRLETDRVYPCLVDVRPDPERHEKELPTAVALMVRRHPRSVRAIRRAEHVPDLTQLDDLDDVQRYLGDHATQRQDTL